MLEILLTLVLLLGLAKRGKRRRKFRRYIRGTINEILSFSGLAASAIVTADFQDTVDDTTWVSSVKATYALNSHTQNRSSGPYLIVLAHSDYTDAEIEQWIELAGNWGQGDEIQKEISKRKIRIVGSIKGADNVAEGTSFIDDGRMVTTKLGWILSEGQTINLGVYNTGSAAQVTTTANLEVNGHANLWPQ